MKWIPEKELREILKDVDGTYGLYVSLPDEGEKLEIDSDRIFNSASTIKIPLLALLLKDFEDGRLDPEQKAPLTEGNRVGGSGILKVMSPSVALSLYDYAILMMVVSDNSATNHITDAVGMDRANAFFAENGWNSTHIACKLYWPKPILPDGTKDFDQTTAADLGDMMEKIMLGQLISKKASDTMMQIMACQQVGKFDKSLPVIKHTDPMLPLPPVPEGRVIVCNKGGTLMGLVLHDAAIMLLPNGRRAVITLMTGTPDNDKTMEIFKRVSRALYDSLMR